MIGFDSQTFIDIGTASSSGIKDWAPVIAATITGGITLFTAVVIASITNRQAKTAANKLALDLFEKRFAVWKEIENAYRKYVDEIVVRYINRAKFPIPDEVIHDWVEVEVDAEWLFGDDVRNQLRRVGARLAALGDHEFPRDSEAEIWELEETMKEVVAEQVGQAFVDLRSLMRPYMMLDTIAVNRPAKVPEAVS